MATTGRTIFVKAVGYKALRNTPKEWVVPRIEEEIKFIFEKTSKVKDRHYPPLDKNVEDGSRCVFINDFKELDSGGFIITVCSYVKGHVPETFSPDMDGEKVDVSVMDLTDINGSPKEVVYTYRVLAFGQIMIVENCMGSGGVSGLQKLLRSLLKRLRPKGHPLIEFSDIASDNLRQLIESKGGVKSVTARIMHDVMGKASIFGRKLTDMRRSVGGANKCMVAWEADSSDEIDADNAIAILQEADENYLDSVSLTFNYGGGVSDLSEYREKKVVRIQLTPEGSIAVTEVEAELKGYLKELRKASSKGPIKSDGTLRNVRKLGG